MMEFPGFRYTSLYFFVFLRFHYHVGWEIFVDDDDDDDYDDDDADNAGDDDDDDDDDDADDAGLRQLSMLRINYVIKHQVMNMQMRSRGDLVGDVHLRQEALRAR